MKAVFVYRGVEHTPDSLISLYLLEHPAEYLSETDYQNWIDKLIQTEEGTFVITNPLSMEDVKKHQFSKIRKKVLKERRDFLKKTLTGKKKGSRIDKMLEAEENEIQAETNRRLAELSEQDWLKLLTEYRKEKERNHKNQFFDQKSRIEGHNESLTEKLIEEFDLPGKLGNYMDDMVKEIQKRVDDWLIKTPKIMVRYIKDDWFDDDFSGYGNSLSRNYSKYSDSFSQIYSDPEEDWDEEDWEEDDWEEDDYYEEELEEEELCDDNIDRFLSYMKDEWSETDDGINSEIYEEESLYSYIIRYLDQALPELNEQEDPDFRDILFDLYDEEIDDCTRTIEIKVDCSPLHVLSCLSQNPVYHELAERTIKSEKEKIALHQEELRKKQGAERLEAERKARIQESILHVMPEHYPDLYPLARKMNRHFILHIGPTNSGKTYAAMQRLREVGEGIYLAPLRLLAYEQYESLNADGIPCSLITGEEREIQKGAKIQASTVEMMSPIQEYPIAVLDEAQMIEDEDRGWAWTAAILGLCCPEIHVCASAFAQDLLQGLIGECGDTYEVVEHERQTELLLYSKEFHFPKDVRKHDALIVFSKKNVHAVAYELRKQGKSCSIIYGNLPYDVRQAEAKRFAAGETDVLVSTDAIGMGLNLPIERVVFLEISKFDGKSVRPLKPAEVQQIAGRAGRRGIFEKGYYAGNPKFIQEKMEKMPPMLKKAVIGFPESLVGLDARLLDIIKQWDQIPVPAGYKRMNTADFKSRVLELETKTENKQLIYAFATMPFNDKGEEKTIWRAMFQKELCGEWYTLEEADQTHQIRNCSQNLSNLEAAYKICDLLYVYFTKFSHLEDLEELLALKKEISYSILDKLSRQELEPKKCKYCGKVMPWNYPYGMCDKCHSERYPQHFYYDYY